MEGFSDNIQGHERAADLIARQLLGGITDAERMELDAWIAENDAHQACFQRCTDPQELNQLMADYHKAGEWGSDLLAAIHSKIAPASPIRTLPTAPQTRPLPSASRIRLLQSPRFKYAAAIILLLGAATYLWKIRSGGEGHADISTTPAQTILPGHKGAILTLADGRQLTLDSLHNGIVANQNGARATLINGELAYQSTGQPTHDISHNTITTPRGRQYQLILPDGTKVWLNAASSITFPTAFTGAERKVTIRGEAYFEVAANTQKPFTVQTGDAAIQVLGTSFNISAYNDEPTIKTTLLEGKVKVQNEPTKESIVLQPGEQGVVAEHLRLNKKVDLEQVIAWKNGLFNFNSTELFTVMQQLSRWYDIDIKYEGKVPALTVSGKMDRGLTLQEILEFLTKNEIKYRLEGRTIIVNDN